MPIETNRDGRTVRTGKSYTDFRRDLYASQTGLCMRCLGFTRLDADPIADTSFHVHHKKGRGMGGGKRDDTFESCEGLCGYCHREEHNQ